MPSKHTPGPWNVDSEWQPTGQPFQVWAGPKGWQTPPSKLVAHVFDEPSARLIAAAPDLLEAARLGLKYVEAGEASLTTQPNIITKDANVLRAAIAKAEGE